MKPERGVQTELNAVNIVDDLQILYRVKRWHDAAHNSFEREIEIDGLIVRGEMIDPGFLPKPLQQFCLWWAKEYEGMN